MWRISPWRLPGSTASTASFSPRPSFSRAAARGGEGRAVCSPGGLDGEGAHPVGGNAQRALGIGLVGDQHLLGANEGLWPQHQQRGRIGGGRGPAPAPTNTASAPVPAGTDGSP